MKYYNIYQSGKEIYLDSKEIPDNKIIVNKYENEQQALKFITDNTLPPRLYCALRNPLLSKKYFILPLVNNNEIIIGTDISAHPGKWEIILIGTSDDYVIEGTDIDQSKITYISNCFSRLFVRDNFLEELDFEEQCSPTFTIFYDDIIDRLNRKVDIDDIPEWSKRESPDKTLLEDGQAADAKAVGDELSKKADKNNPVFTGSISMSRLCNSTVGEKSVGLGNSVVASGNYSHAEGDFTTASGESSHAEGASTTASAPQAHAEGYDTTASDYQAHAEGASTTASAPQAHAEGYDTTASGLCAHAEGTGTKASGAMAHTEGAGTTASSDYQHVQGRYNIEDTENKYAHIVGNGTGYKSRSNAHTLDWDGNAWYAGKLTQEGMPENEKDLTTKKYVDDGLSDKLTVPQTAKVGQIFRVQAVNEDGTLTVEAVDASECAVTDVTVDGQSVLVENGVVEIPVIEENKFGVAKTLSPYGVYSKNGFLFIKSSTNDSILKRSSGYEPIVPKNLDYAVKCAMCDNIGVAWTAEEQAAARNRMGIGDYELIADIILSSDTKSVEIEYDSEGLPLNLVAFKVFVIHPIPIDASITNGYIVMDNSDGSVTYYGSVHWKKSGCETITVCDFTVYGCKSPAILTYSDASKIQIATPSTVQTNCGNKLSYYDRIEKIRISSNGVFEAGARFIVLGKDA